MKRRADWFAEEPFSLLLSAGFFGFFAHTGLLDALEANQLVPRRVAGVSAGALAGGLWAAGTGAEQLGEHLEGLTRQDFWDPGLPLGGLLRGRKFAGLLSDILEHSGSSQFSECRVPFSAVVHDVFARRTVRLDSGELGPAIRASCAVPVMFRPVRIDGRVYVDGGVSDRAGFSALADGERTLYHHLRHRSPWSGIAGPEAAETKATPGREVLCMDELPRVTPFRLERGPRARAMARESAMRWLDEPLTEDEAS